MVGKKVKIEGLERFTYYFCYKETIYPYNRRVKKELGGYIQRNLSDDIDSGFLCKPVKFSLTFIPEKSEIREVEGNLILANEVVVFKNVFSLIWFTLFHS